MPRIMPSQVVRIIDQVFPRAKDHDPQARLKLRKDDAFGLAGVVRLIDDILDELLRLGAQDYAEFITALESIRQSIATWPHQGGAHELAFIPGFQRMNPLFMIRSALLKCPDEYPPSDIAGLEFVDDSDLRDNLRLDLARISRALSNQEYKASTVLAGSAIEALLLWALEKHTSPQIKAALKQAKASSWIKNNPPADNLVSMEWSLRQYTETAGELDIIKKATREQLRLVTEFRNLIHPGRAIRLKEECDRGTAMAATAGLEFVIRDLAHAFP